MLDPIVNAIRDFFLETVGAEWCVFFCSMIPIIELRGAIPMGALFGIPWWLTYLLSVLGNMAPVPFILLLSRERSRGCPVLVLNFLIKSLTFY